jgi:hypothetical protein
MSFRELNPSRSLGLGVSLRNELRHHVFRQLLLLTGVNGLVVQPRHVLHHLVVQLLVLGAGGHQPALRLLLADLQVRADDGPDGAEGRQRAVADFGGRGAVLDRHERRLAGHREGDALAERQFRPDLGVLLDAALFPVPVAALARVLFLVLLGFLPRAGQRSGGRQRVR